MKRRYLTLDAMRGVAALAVVALHLTQRFGGHGPTYGYLAVDLFFVLSGFVLSYSYDERLGNGSLTLGGYLRKRIVRLIPLYILGIVLGVASLLAQPKEGVTGVRLVVAALINTVALPSPIVSPIGASFPINPAFWSLFFEFWIASLAFGVFHKQLRGRVLAAVIVAGAVGNLVTIHHFHDLNEGWGFSPESFLAGLSRVAFSCGAGVALARRQRRAPVTFRVPSWICLTALGVLLYLAPKGVLGHVYEAACVLVAFPALVFVSTGAVERFPLIGRLFGDASYAIYAIHFPMITFAALLFGTTISRHRTPLELTLMAMFVFLALVVAEVDERLRKGRWTLGQR